MAIDTLFVFCGVYGDTADALEDYELVKKLHTQANLIDSYDAAVIERDHKGKVKIVKKHETPTRVGGVLGGGVGLATGLVIVLFPAAAIGGGLLLGTTGAGALLGALAGHAAAGMSRGDLKDLGESLDEGEAGLVVVAVSDMDSKVRSAMKRAQKIEENSSRRIRKRSRPTPRPHRPHRSPGLLLASRKRLGVLPTGLRLFLRLQAERRILVVEQQRVRRHTKLPPVHANAEVLQ